MAINLYTTRLNYQRTQLQTYHDGDVFNQRFEGVKTSSGYKPDHILFPPTQRKPEKSGQPRETTEKAC